MGKTVKTYLIDTPRRERTGILGSTKPLKLDSLQSLTLLVGFSPSVNSGMPYPICIAEAVRWAAMPLLLQLPCKFCLILKQIRFKKLFV
jgi:hypothetical protein